MSKYKCKKEWINHFGVRTQKRDDGDKLTRENYIDLNLKDPLLDFQIKVQFERTEESLIEEYKGYIQGYEGTPFGEKLLKLLNNKIEKLRRFQKQFSSPDHYKAWRIECAYENFDLNMKYFASLDHAMFNKWLTSFVKENEFTEINDLSNWAHWCWDVVYILVLDEYNVCYLGQTQQPLRQRIGQHWNKKKPLSRLIFPTDAVCSSRISIDSFRILDTTRIFVLRDFESLFKETNPKLLHLDYRRRHFMGTDCELAELLLTKKMNHAYSINRVMGGQLNSYGVVDGSEIIDRGRLS